MTRFRFLMPLCLVAGLVSLACTATQNTAAPETSEMPSEVTGDPKIQNALSAAPTGIATDAAVMDFPATPGGPMVELRKGTNGWTCLPDVPDSPANDPMCMDKNAMQWADAWMSKKTPALSGTGIGYMLQGGATADNDDPFAKTPKAGKNWLMEPPHLMVFGTKLDPTVHSNQPNTTQPWVMWKGTPYEHLMVPVK